MASKFASSAEAELTCPVCFQFYVRPHNPKNLSSCSHICCLLCLKEMTKDGRRIIECPQCKQVTVLPDQGVDGLHTSLTVRNLAEKHPQGIRQRVQQMQSALRNIQLDKSKTMKKIEEMKEQLGKDAKEEEAEVEKAVESALSQAQDFIAQIRNAHQRKRAQLLQLQIQQTNDTDVIQSELQTIADDDFLLKADAYDNTIYEVKADHLIVNTRHYSIGRFIADDQIGRIIRPIQLQLVQDICDAHSTVSIACGVDGTLAVCNAGANPAVSVYEKHQESMTKKCQFTVTPALQDSPIDIAINAEDRIIITTYGPRFHVVTTQGKQLRTVSTSKQVQESWRPRLKKEAFTVSVAKLSDDRVVVGVSIKSRREDSYESSLLVYDSKLAFSKVIPITIMPVRIADIRGTHIAVCNSKDTLCVYSIESGEETLTLLLLMPCGICYDQLTGCLLIGRGTEKNTNGKIERGSCVIDQYCSITGKLVACLAKQLCCPAGLTITHDGLLAVADDKSIKIFRMH